MSIKQEEYSFYYKVKNESARKRLGFKAGFFWCTAKKQSLALSRGELAMDAAGFDEADFARPVRVHFPVENDIPPEGVFDTKFCENREPGGEDGKTMILIPGAVPADPFHGEAVEDTAVTSDTPVTAPGTDSDDTGSAPLPAYAYNVNGEPMEDVEKEMLQPVASMDERHRILSQFILEDKFSHRITPEQLSEVSGLELDMSNSYIQDMLLACHNVPGIQKLDNPNLWKFTDAFKKIFPKDKRHTLHMMMNFAQAYADAHPIDRALLAKEWQKGNRVSCINRTPSGANAGGSILTDRGEGFVHDRASLARDVATGVLARSMDVDIYNLHPAHAKRVDEIVADNKPPFDVFCKAFLNMPGGMDYSRAIVVASVKEAPTGIEAIPARVTEYLNRVLTETDHASPDPVIVDIACGRTSQPMPMKGSANDDEEKPQSAGELADEQTAPETVEQDTTEHHPDPQPLDAQSPVGHTWPEFFEPGRYEGVPNDIYHAANGISSTMVKDARVSLMYYEGRHVSKTIKKERSKVLDMGNLVHVLALQPEILDAEFSIEPEIPEGALTTTATIRAVIDEYNASLTPQLSADEIKTLLEEYNSSLPAPVPLGGDKDAIGIAYLELPDDFKRIVGDDKNFTVSTMKACIKEYNATLPPQVKTSGNRDALLEQLAIINPDLVAQEAQKPQPLKVSGAKADLIQAVKSVKPDAVFADELLDAWRENPGNKILVTRQQYETALAIQSALYAHPEAGKLLQNPTRAVEVSYFGIDDDTGLDIRVRPDVELEYEGLRIGFDLKTISMWDVKEDSLKSRLHREITMRDYHLSAGMYCNVADLDKFAWIFVNKDEGYHWVAVVWASGSLLELGKLEYRRTIRAIANAMDTGEWPAPVTADYTDELNDYDLRRLEALREMA
ncbi:exodeoxyribonuclease [Salmonella enterica]|nr:exodeoxyribonuclease [Salmonella enterica]